MKAKRTDIAVIGSEAFIKAFMIVGVEKAVEIESTIRSTVRDIKEKIRELVKGDEYSIFIIEEEYLSLVQDLIEETRYSVFPIFISLPGPSRIKVHDPKSYYLNKIKGVLGISIEI